MELEAATGTEQREKEQSKRLQKQYREAQEDQAELLKKEQDALQKKHELVSDGLDFNHGLFELFAYYQSMFIFFIITGIRSGRCQ